MNDTRSLKYTEHTYGTENELQRLGVWRWTSAQAAQHSVTGDPYAPKTKYWLVYIHGGVWRDPRITHLQAKAGVSSLGGSESNQARIAGFASLDYRLSPHPEFPQDPATTPSTKLRNAKHPDHLSDVRSALAFLRSEYKVGNGEGETPYVLYGHSCGATLAWQVVMGFDDCGPGGDEVPMPAAVVGFQGMYDLVGLNSRFGGAYRDMIAGAFGYDEEVWKDVSPARFADKFSETWFGCEKRVGMLAYSSQDEWIDMAEIDTMEARLKQEEKAGIRVQTRRDLTGDHDAVAEDGRTIADVLMQTIAGLDHVARI